MDSDNDMEDDEHEEVHSESDLELEEICPLRDDSKVTYQSHTGGILCLSLDENNDTIYTGGLDDKIFAWQLSSGRMMAVLSGHTDSVTHVSVNNTGSTLASADMNGCVILWRRSANAEQWDKLFEIEAASIVGVNWSYSQGLELLYVCDVTGTVQSWSMERLDQGPVQYKYGQGCSCSKYGLALNESWSVLLYGDDCDEHKDCNNTGALCVSHNGGDRNLKVDLRSMMAYEDSDDQCDEGLGAGWAHKCVSNNAHTVVIGDWSQMIVANISLANGANMPQCHLGRVVLKDCGLVDNVALSLTMPYVSYATKQGIIGVYDLIKQTVRYQWNYASTLPMELRSTNGEEQTTGVSQMCWSPTKPVFYTTGVDGRLCLWDGRAAPTNMDVPTLWGYSGIVWDMRVSRDGSSLVVASEDKMARLFSI